MQNFIYRNHPAKGIPRIYPGSFILDKSMYNWVDEINTNQKKISQYKNLYFLKNISTLYHSGVTFTKSVILRQFHKTCRKINRKLRVSPTTKYYDRSYDHTYNFRKTKIPWQRYFHF